MGTWVFLGNRVSVLYLESARELSHNSEYSQPFLSVQFCSVKMVNYVFFTTVKKQEWTSLDGRVSFEGQAEVLPRPKEELPRSHTCLLPPAPGRMEPADCSSSLWMWPGPSGYKVGVLQGRLGSRLMENLLSMLALHLVISKFPCFCWLNSNHFKRYWRWIRMYITFQNSFGLCQCPS